MRPVLDETVERLFHLVEAEGKGNKLGKRKIINHNVENLLPSSFSLSVGSELMSS